MKKFFLIIWDYWKKIAFFLGNLTSFFFLTIFYFLIFSFFALPYKLIAKPFKLKQKNSNFIEKKKNLSNIEDFKFEY